MSFTVCKVKVGKRRTTLKKILMDKKKRIRLSFLISGLLFIAIGFFFSKPTQNRSFSNPAIESTNQDEVISFSQEPVSIDKAFLTVQVRKKTQPDPPIRIIIPELNIDLQVKQAKVNKGYWEVFSDSAGFGMGSAYPGEVGNQVIFAHAREGLFLPLKNAKIGQIVYVLTKDHWFQYKVEEIKEVLPSEKEVIASTDEKVLTLYTCSGFADSKRLIIKAKQIN